MAVIYLSKLDLGLASLLILGLALLSFSFRLGLEKTLLLAAARTTIQLLLVGLVLKTLFETSRLEWVVLMALFMGTAAGYEVRRRQKTPLRGWWAYGLGTFSLFLSSFSVTFFALRVLVEPVPWYEPQYSIPLLGMMLGNSMTGVALSVDSLTRLMTERRTVIEARLLLGDTWYPAVSDVLRESMRIGMIPIINAMAAAGLVSLPGMMTGQILAGNPPIEAVKYQILIMFLVATVTGIGSILSVLLTAARLFDDRHRLRLDRLTGSSP